MPLYPIFLSLAGRPVLVVGAGPVALRKTLGLLESGAQVTVVAPEALPEFDRLPVRLLRRKYRASDLSGAALVFAATSDRAANHSIAQSARRRRILANIADSAPECDFVVPARLTHNQFQIAISTNARSPRAAAALRRKLEEFLQSQPLIQRGAAEAAEETRRNPKNSS